VYGTLILFLDFVSDPARVGRHSTEIHGDSFVIFAIVCGQNLLFCVEFLNF